MTASQFIHKEFSTLEGRERCRGIIESVKKEVLRKDSGSKETDADFDAKCCVELANRNMGLLESYCGALTEKRDYYERLNDIKSVIERP